MKCVRLILLVLLVGLPGSLIPGSLFAEEAALVKIPAGSIKPFWIDTLSRKDKRNSQQPKAITVSGLWSQSRPVTHQEFAAFLQKNPQWQRDQVSPLFADESYLRNFSAGAELKNDIPPRSPATYVSWFAAKAYCESREMRLPTTDEWEYMAAASEKKRDASNDPEFMARILEWYGRPQDGKLRDVESVYKNLYGLWDMHGQIWEWVEDFNSNLVTGESREDSSFNRDLFCGAGNLSGGNKENYAAFMRYAFRSSLKGKSSIWNLGFRCVRSL